jgi:DNA-binding SARP family transcriptional activator
VIHVRTLGPVEVTVDGGAAPPEALWKKNLALLVYLARSPRRARARDHLVGLLWADKPEVMARHSLREAVRVLRRALGEPVIEMEGGQVRLGEGQLRLDADDFEAHTAAGDWAAAARLVGGDFLEGFGVPDASPFEDWLAAEQTAWRRRAVDAMVRHADLLLKGGRPAEAVERAQRAFAMDGASEAAARTLMRGLALGGDRAGALACYEAFARRLSGDLDAEPDADTRDLAERIRKERVWREPAALAPSAAGATRRAPLVGRESELRRLVEAWDASRRDRRSGAAVISGDAGSGVTRLIEELAGRARLDGATVAVMRAVEADQAEPWSGLIGLARGGLLDAPGIAGAPPGALAAFADLVLEWADRFGSAVKGITPLPASRALGEVLGAATEERPALLVLDDAQWLDRDSLLALRAATRDLARAPLFLAFGAISYPARPELDDLRARLGRDLAGVSLTLAPLDGEALRELAAWALPRYDSEQQGRLARRLGADSAGLPLLAVELAHAVAHGLDLLGDRRAWPEPLRTLTHTLPGELPDTVTAAIRVGFGRLSQNARKVLAVASVLADRLTVQSLASGSGLSGAALEAALDELEWQRWLAADARGYTFVARIVRDVVARDMVTPGQRRRILEASGHPT